MKLFDIHAHLDFKDYDADRAEVIRRTRQAECGVINVGVDLATSRAVIKLAEENDLMWATVGIHPTEYQGFPSVENWAELEKLATHDKVVAIGECGLEKRGGRVEGEAWRKQIETFERQIEIAKKINKPLMIHCREAYSEVLGILKLHASNFNLRANIHCFTGNWEQAKKFLDPGFTISFTGIITFTQQYDEVVKMIPLEKIMAETDSPFLAPVPYRGQRNEPLYVAEVVKKIAEIKGLPFEEAEQKLLNNALAFARRLC